jgi:hypothetical protein
MPSTFTSPPMFCLLALLAPGQHFTICLPLRCWNRISLSRQHVAKAYWLNLLLHELWNQIKSLVPPVRALFLTCCHCFTVATPSLRCCPFACCGAASSQPSMLDLTLSPRTHTTPPSPARPSPDLAVGHFPAAVRSPTGILPPCFPHRVNLHLHSDQDHMQPFMGLRSSGLPAPPASLLGRSRTSAPSGAASSFAMHPFPTNLHLRRSLSFDFRASSFLPRRTTRSCEPAGLLRFCHFLCSMHMSSHF